MTFQARILSIAMLTGLGTNAGAATTNAVVPRASNLMQPHANGGHMSPGGGCVARDARSPSLPKHGTHRNSAAAGATNALTKLVDSQAVLACTNRPRFGANKVLSEKQVTDLVALLFDPESPVNK